MTQDRVVTPEAVALELETAGAGSRLAAALFDWFLVTIAWYALTFVLAIGGAVAAAGSLPIPDYLVVVLIGLLTSLGVFAYFIGQETLWRGRTLGKALLGLRVVTVEGGQIRFRHAFIRGVFLLIDAGISGGLVGFVSILASKRSQRLGDMVAGTIVLRERTALQSPTAVTFPPPRGLEHYTSTLDTTRLGAQEYQTIRSFLLRAPNLHPNARYQLAIQIADPVRDLVRPLPPDGIQPELFLAAVAAAAQQRQRAAAPARPRAPMPARPPGPPPPGWPAPGRQAPGWPTPATGHAPPAPPPSPAGPPPPERDPRAPVRVPPPPPAAAPRPARDEDDGPGFAPPN